MNQDRLENLRPQRHVHFNDQIPPQQSVYGASNQGYGGQHPNPNMGQSQSRLNPQQPGNYPNAQPIPHPNHRPPQQSNNYGNTAINAYHNQVQSHAPVPNGYTNPYSGVPPAQDYSRGFSLVPDYGYQPPVPSYPPTTYGASGYSGWPPGEGYASYAQSSWPQGYMPAPTYLASPNFAPWYQASYPYPYPQPSFPNDPLPPAPPNNEHSCGVAGNLPPGTPKPKPLDPAKEENNQNEAQDDQNQEDTSNENNESARNADGQSNANDDSQGWSNDDGNQTQAGESDWNTANTGGGQNDNWDTTATPTAAATSDWTHTPASTAQTNDAASSWNASADASAQAPGTLNNAPNLTQQGPATFAYPQAFQQSVQQPGTQPAPPPPLPSAASTHSRPLYGPHGTYYSTYHSSTLRGPRPDAAEEPPYDVPAGTLTTHQVKPGEGYMYVHKRRSPDYLDSLDEPYARFVFKYRTKGVSSGSPECPAENEVWADYNGNVDNLMYIDRKLTLLAKQNKSKPKPVSKSKTSQQETRRRENCKT